LGIQPILVGREVTKMHEEWQFASADQLARHFADPHGEFVVVVPALDPTVSPAEKPDDADVFALFGQITEKNALGRREAVRQVAETLKLPTKYVYEAIERAKNIG
jgi:16S rRNA C1402 (ribose-2'-O) methylase RsmI